MPNTPVPAPLTVWLEDCDAGWIFLHVSNGSGERVLACTHWDDPFPGIVRWAKRILAGSPREVALINEEGRYAHLVATAATGADMLNFTIHRTAELGDLLPPPVLRWQGTRAELVATVYRAIHDFAASPAYNPRQWAYMRLSAWLVFSDPASRPLSVITAALLATPRKRLLREIKASCPYCNRHTGASIPCVWNRSTTEVRRPILQRLLRTMPGSWDACDLPLLRSRALEELCYGAPRPLPERLRRIRS